MSSAPRPFLTPLDASFLYAERPTEPMHIGGLMVYEGDLSAEELRALIDARLHTIARYRQRVLFPPLPVSHPVWVDDPEFDLRNHISEVHLPEDASLADITTLAADVYRRPLDRDHPLWHGTVLRGFPAATMRWSGGCTTR